MISLKRDFLRNATFGSSDELFIDLYVWVQCVIHLLLKTFFYVKSVFFFMKVLRGE